MSTIPIPVTHTFVSAIAEQSNPALVGPNEWNAAHTATVPIMGASGASHTAGVVPDPGSSSGIVRFLREDASWDVPTTFGASGASHSVGYVPDPGASAGSTRFLREDATFAIPPVTPVTILPFGIPSTYNFAAQTPGGSLSVGANTITLNPMPTGINAASIGVSCVYISGGTGTAEAPLITGWSATTITFTCVYTHTGAWTIQSASAGIQEAIIALGPTSTRLIIPGGSIGPVYGPISVPYTMSIRGFGIRNSVVNMASGYSGRAFQIIAPTYGYGVDFGDFCISYITSSTAGEALYLQEVVDGVVSNLLIVRAYDGITGYGLGRVHFIGCNITPMRNAYNLSSNSSSSIINVCVPTIIGGFLTMNGTTGTVFNLGPTIAGMVVKGVQSVLGNVAVSLQGSSGAVNEITWEDCIFDSLSGQVFNVQLSGTATSYRWKIVNCMLSLVSGGVYGILVYSTVLGSISGWQIGNTSVVVNNATATGIQLSGVIGFTMSGLLVSNNVAGGDAISILYYACTDVVITGSQLGVGAAYNPTNPMSYGVLLDGNAHNRITILANQTVGSTNQVKNNSSIGAGAVTWDNH